MWVLKRLAELGVSLEDILLTYESRVRVHLEMNVPLWHFSIPRKISDNIERVQRAAAFIILGKLASRDYICNLALLGLEPLSERREGICREFARKTMKHPEHNKMFTMVDGRQTRTKRKVVVPVYPAKTARYDRSAVPNLARIINNL